MLTLYYAPGACSMAPHIVLEEIGVPFEAKPVAMLKGEHLQAAFQTINPRGKVPVLVVDGQSLTENIAILTYLAERHPEAHLLPSDPWSRAQVLSTLAWIASSVHTSFGPLFMAQRFVQDEPGREQLVASMRRAIDGYFSEIDQMLAGKEWAFGTYSIVDPYLFVYFSWAKNFFRLDVSRFPHYEAHAQRLLARPAVQRALAREAETRTQAA